MDEQRVMEVWCPAWKQTGSGYLVTDSLILTAYHNVRHDGQASDGLQVRQLDRNGQTTWLAAERIWPEHEPDLTQDPSADAALLQIVAPSWDPAKLSPVRWGRVVGTDRIPCKSLGFSDAEKRPDNTRDTMPIRGHLEPLHAMKTSLLTIHVNEGIVPKRLAQGSGWAGMSGAAVFCGPLLTGILITEHDIADSNEVLFAVPITSLRATPGFTPTLRAAGGNPDVENINGAPAAPYTGSLNPQLDATVLYVGNESLNYWREEAPYRGLLESPALNLRWSTAEARLMDRTSNGKLPDGKACSPPASPD